MEASTQECFSCGKTFLRGRGYRACGVWLAAANAASVSAAGKGLLDELMSESFSAASGSSRRHDGPVVCMSCYQVVRPNAADFKNWTPVDFMRRFKRAVPPAACELGLRDRSEIQEMLKKQRTTLRHADEAMLEQLLCNTRRDVRVLRAGGAPDHVAAASEAAAATPLHHSTPARPSHLFSVGSVVVVAQCTMPGQPLRSGGIARVQTLHADGTYDVRYTINSGGERGLDDTQLSAYTVLHPRRIDENNIALQPLSPGSAMSLRNELRVSTASEGYWSSV